MKQHPDRKNHVPVVGAGLCRGEHPAAPHDGRRAHAHAATDRPHARAHGGLQTRRLQRLRGHDDGPMAAGTRGGLHPAGAGSLERGVPLYGRPGQDRLL